MSTAIANVAEREFSAEARQLLSEVSAYVKSRGLEVSASGMDSVRGASLKVQRGRADLEIIVKNPDDFGRVEQIYSAWGFEIEAQKAGSPSACRLVRVRNEWRARNPETFRMSGFRRGGQARQVEPLTEDDGYVLVENPSRWLEEQIDLVFGGTDA